VRFKLGGFYEVFFTDHSFGCDKPFQCKVPGYVVEDADEYVKLTVWETLTDDNDVREDNFEFVCIMKSTIKRRRHIK